MIEGNYQRLILENITIVNAVLKIISNCLRVRRLNLITNNNKIFFSNLRN